MAGRLGRLPLLSDGLVPARWLESPPGTVLAYLESAEAFRHPFAVTTVLHFSLQAAGAGSTEDQEQGLLDSLLCHRLGEGQPGQVRDGAPLSLLSTLPAQDADRLPARYEPASSFVSLSGVHEVDDPEALAYRLASLYQKTSADKGRPMNTDKSGIGVTDQRVAMLLPKATQSRVECLHHNITTLLACMENMAAIVRPEATTVAADWYQRQAALLLNHLYRRKPLPKVDGIYKSRVAGMWIEHRDLAADINRVNDQAQSPPPALP